MVENTYNLLIDALENKDLVFYKTMAKILKCDPRHVDKEYFEIDEVFKANGLPPISTIIVNSETYTCGDGYFKEHYPGEADRDAIWINNYNELIKNKKKAIDLLK